MINEKLKQSGRICLYNILLNSHFSIIVHTLHYITMQTYINVMQNFLKDDACLSFFLLLALDFFNSVRWLPA